MAASTPLLYTWIGSVLASILCIILSVAILPEKMNDTTEGKAKGAVILYLLSGLFATVFVITLIAWLVVRSQSTVEQKMSQSKDDASLNTH